MLDAAEFDKFAEEYLAAHAQNLKVSGEGPDYFARYKIDELARLWAKRKTPPPATILDFGCGIGASLPHLRRQFPTACLTGVDVSARSLEIAAVRFPDVAQLVLAKEGAAPVAEASQDLIFTACVFHHIPEDHHVALFADLRARLTAKGALVVFEHNPLNPVTRYIVATCPFDENAVLISAASLRARLQAAGFSQVEIRFTGFFPGPLAALRPLEPLLNQIPIGAQYYALATA